MNVTLNQLKIITPSGNLALLESLVDPLNRILPRYDIDTPLRVAHFLAQAAHETADFRTLVEYGPDSYFRRYDGRKDLGNTVKGDGLRYKGRGIFQLTGRINYRVYGQRIGIDLENNPAKAAEASVSVQIACEYWKAKGLNGWADRDDVNEITRRINGGYNGLQDRKNKLAKAKACFPDVMLVANMNDAKASDITEEVPDAPIASEPVKPWWQQINKETIMHWVGGGGVFGGAWNWLSKKLDMIDTPAEIALVIAIGCIALIALALVLRHWRYMAEVGQK